MKNNLVSILLKILIILALGIGIVIGYVSSSDAPIEPPKVSPITQESPHQVKKITVISGNTFDIELWDDNRRVLGYLDVNTTPDAAQAVVEFLNDSDNPTVTLHQRKEGENGPGWEVTIKVTHNGSSIDLTEWLVHNNLVWK